MSKFLEIFITYEPERHLSMMKCVKMNFRNMISIELNALSMLLVQN